MTGDPPDPALSPGPEPDVASADTTYVTGWRCATCGARADVAALWPWRCPNAIGDDRHHVLRIVRPLAPLRPLNDPNPFIAFDAEWAWSAFAAAHGMDRADRHALVIDVDRTVARVDGTGFAVTPCRRANALSDALRFSSNGGVWIKDETNNVSGSHKARHLVTILLHLLAAESLGLTDAQARSPLAIASCGNAALAAATLAAATAWPITVFVPPHANANVVARLHVLGATVEACPRRSSDPPGDPCVHRFRDSVARGAIPFAVQGPENALCLDGGRSIGFEICEALGHFVDHVFVQVGGGALITGVGDGLGVGGVHPRIHAVQTEGCAPLARAVARAASVDDPASRWSSCMTPWENQSRSIATGILDDETYDWLGALDALRTGGRAVVVAESDVLAANELALVHTDVDVDHTGSAGLAGLLAARRNRDIEDDERVVVIFSGRRR